MDSVVPRLWKSGWIPRFLSERRRWAVSTRSRRCSKTFRRRRRRTDIQTNVRVTLDEGDRHESRDICSRDVTSFRGKETQPARNVKVDVPRGVETDRACAWPEKAFEASVDAWEAYISTYRSREIRDLEGSEETSSLASTFLSPPPRRRYCASADSGRGHRGQGAQDAPARRSTSRGRSLPRLGSVLLGDLFVRFSVSTPNLSPRQEELLREFAERTEQARARDDGDADKEAEEDSKAA